MMKILLPISVLVVMSLTACQSDGGNSAKMLEESPIGVPSSKGPSENPSSIGPSSPAPDQTFEDETNKNTIISTPQAMTEKENIKIVLPVDNR